MLLLTSWSELVCDFRQIVSAGARHLSRICFADDVLCRQSRQPVARRTPPEIVSRRNAGKSAGVVVESGGVVQSCGFDDLVEVAAHPVQTVEEPPRRTQLECGVVPRKRRKFSPVSGLVKCEQNQRKLWVVPKGIQ